MFKPGSDLREGEAEQEKLLICGEEDEVCHKDGVGIVAEVLWRRQHKKEKKDKPESLRQDEPPMTSQKH